VIMSISKGLSFLISGRSKTAVNLATPATTADSSLAAAAAAISITTGAVSTISASTVGTVATPTVGKKRKVRP
jgi:hypothetical protein